MRPSAAGPPPLMNLEMNKSSLRRPATVTRRPVRRVTTLPSCAGGGDTDASDFPSLDLVLELRPVLAVFVYRVVYFFFIFMDYSFFKLLDGLTASAFYDFCDFGLWTVVVFFFVMRLFSPYTVLALLPHFHHSEGVYFTLCLVGADHIDIATERLYRAFAFELFTVFVAFVPGALIFTVFGALTLMDFDAPYCPSLSIVMRASTAS